MKDLSLVKIVMQEGKGLQNTQIFVGDVRLNGVESFIIRAEAGDAFPRVVLKMIDYPQVELWMKPEYDVSEETLAVMAEAKGMKLVKKETT